MGKILYIEDQLTMSIASIKKLFSPIFTDERTLMLLDDIENSHYKTPELIIEACSYTSCLDICHTYINALAKIINNYKDYDLVIIDRNLSENPYHKDIEGIKNYLKQCGFNDPEEKINAYKTREGDLILLILLKLDKNFKNKIYYLTANLDELRGCQMLRTLIDVDDFNEHHIIEKSPEKELFLSKLISDLPTFAIQNEFRIQCDIIRKRLGEDSLNEFINLIKYYDKDKRREFVMFLRKLLDNILHDIAFMMAEPDADYWNQANRKQLQIKGFLKGFPSRRNRDIFVGLPAYDNKHSIGYNSIIRNACLSIFEICSDCGVHELSRAIDIESMNVASLSHYTMKTLLNQICDVIIWYGAAAEFMV